MKPTRDRRAAASGGAALAVLIALFALAALAALAAFDSTGTPGRPGTPGTSGAPGSFSGFTRFLAPVAGNADPRIGLVLLYEATHPTWVEGLWLGEERKIGRRGSAMYLSPYSPKQEAASLEPRPVPRIRARWRYAAIEPADEAARQALPDDALGWREASAEIELREASGPRLVLRLVFDRERLQVHRAGGGRPRAHSEAAPTPK